MLSLGKPSRIKHGSLTRRGNGSRGFDLDGSASGSVEPADDSVRDADSGQKSYQTE